MRCRAGDAAYITRLRDDRYNGRTVTVVEHIGDLSSMDPTGVVWRYGLHDCWWVRPGGWSPPTCALNGRGLFVMPDAHLTPLRPPGVPTATDADIEITA